MEPVVELRNQMKLPLPPPILLYALSVCLGQLRRVGMTWSVEKRHISAKISCQFVCKIQTKLQPLILTTRTILPILLQIPQILRPIQQVLRLIQQIQLQQTILIQLWRLCSPPNVSTTTET